ncbi:MAG: DUF115 domain-containing protein [Peptococcaceae bacterium]|nr:DUF115 domain-containing protein [Peptococcaceae bacterium]
MGNNENYIKNLKTLKASFPDIWQKVKTTEATLDKSLVQAVVSKSGLANLLINDEYLYNQENPLDEAFAFIDQFKNIDSHSDILFYGCGLGYQIKAFRERYPDKPFNIYEPVPEIFYQFLHHADLGQYPPDSLKSIYIESHPDDPDMFCFSLVKKIRSSILIIDHPFYKKAFPDKHQAFFSHFEKHLRERRMSLATCSTFQKRWTINSMKNLAEVLSSPNILLEKKGFFKNKPALLVASGPSLEEEIENVRKIRTNGSAYIFAVGTAVNALVKRGIYPHAACTYDPSEENRIVCKEVLARDIQSIPLIFGSTVGYETLETYPGSKMHMLINQDTPASYFLKPLKGRELEYVNDAASIAVIALQLLFKLGFNPIILVGQNLAYLHGKNYTAGCTYPSYETVLADSNDAIPVKGVDGKEVLSNSSFISMRLQLENYLSSSQEIKVINTTKGGAEIKGTKFQPLAKVMKEYLRKPVVEEDWAKMNKHCYDPEHLLAQNLNMENAKEKISALLDRCMHDLTKIGEVATSDDLISIERSYEQFNLSMENLRSNLFFSIFVTPMSRVELEFLLLSIPEISGERDPAKKAQMMEKEFRPYLKTCEQDINTILPLFQELNNSIRQYYQNYQLQKKAASIKLLLLDADGILTDGSVYYSASGEELKRFNVKDRVGILRLQELGIKTVLIIPEGEEVLKNAAKKLGVNDTVCGNRNIERIISDIKKNFLLDDTAIACLFNDLCHPELFRTTGLSIAMKNASEGFRQDVDYILTTCCGEGVILEIAEIIAKSKSQY